MMLTFKSILLLARLKPGRKHIETRCNMIISESAANGNQQNREKINLNVPQPIIKFSMGNPTSNESSAKPPTMNHTPVRGERV